MELTLYQDKSLIEILEPLLPQQRNYLCMRIRGASEEDALRLINRKTQALVRIWRQNPVFASIEAFLLSNADKYIKDTTLFVFGGMNEKSRAVLDILLNLGMDWEHLKQGDKPYVMKAVELMSKLTPHPKNESYEEMLIRIRRKS